MNWYKIIIARKDDTTLEQAKTIANSIILLIRSTKNLYGTGIPYNQSTKTFDLSSVVPNLQLKFLKQPGFGKNKDLGRYAKNIISIALQSKLYNDALSYVYEPNGKVVNNSMRINERVADFLEKPNNYETLIHEIIHMFDESKTKGLSMSNIETDNYYSSNAEYNAFFLSFLTHIENLNFEEAYDKLKQQYWFNELTEKEKQRTTKRLYFFCQNK
jgi:hypothetical protein